MKLEIVLDTETTGLDPEKGHRVVEIGCVELANYIPTGRTFQIYINPQRSMPPEAFAVHGLSGLFLEKFQPFKDQAAAFLEFIGTKPLIIHNAAFDMKFLQFELSNAGFERLSNQVVDTLEIARRKFPGARASLDMLCRRFEINNSHREKHGALLDAQILAQVYLELSGGRQPHLSLHHHSPHSQGGRHLGQGQTPETQARASLDSEGLAQPSTQPLRPRPLPPLTQAELLAHAALLRSLGAQPWATG